MRIPMEWLLGLHPFVGEILERLSTAGHEAVVVGGAVRDAILSVQSGETYAPEDVDIATSAPPEEVRELFPDCKVLTVGEAFGVVVLVAPDGQEYEVATFRTEEGYADGRRPDRVRFASLPADLRRRDFTINGLAATADGKVIDLVGGLPDLGAGLIRTIGDPWARFSEDYLRMLRAVRFACQLGFQIEGTTQAAIVKNAEKIKKISWERIRDELLRILATPRGAVGMELLAELGLLSAILPEIAALRGVPQPEVYHPEGDVFVHTMAALRVADGVWDDPILKLGILFHDAGKPKSLARAEGEHMGGHEVIGAVLAEEALRRLRLPIRQIEHVKFLVREHMRVGRLADMGLGKQVRLLAAGEREEAPLWDLPHRFPPFADLLRLSICDAEASAHRSSAWLPLLSQAVRLMLHVRRVHGIRRARELICGDDLLAMGEPPGPRLGEVLAEVHERILAGEITTREEALSLAARLLGQDPPG